MVKTGTRINFLFLLLVGSTSYALSGAPGKSPARPDAVSDTVTLSAWSIVIKAKLGIISDSLATLGVKPDATPLYDAVYDVPHPPEIGDYLEVYFPHSGDNWPPIWGSQYAFDFTSPLTPRWVFSVVTNMTPGTVTLSWDTSRINRLPAGYPLMMKDSASAAQINMRTQNSYSFQYSGPRLFTVRADAGATSYSLSPGWNMISLARSVADSSKFVLFPNATSPAFTYTGAYIVQNMLGKGKGYWIRFQDQQSVSILGLAIPSLDIPVSFGWNLVGSVDGSIPAPKGGTIISRWFSYDGGYQPMDTLKSGRGYWVKVSGSGTIHLGPGPASAEKASSDRPDEPTTLIDITDRGNGHQQLQLYPGGVTEGNIAQYDLPPLPSSGAFDARFSTQRSRASYGSSLPEKFIVEIQSPGYPVTIQVTPADPDILLLLTDRLSGTELGTSGALSPLRVVLPNPGTRQVELTVLGSKNQPSGFYMQQNYPNPFNPVSTIRYSLAGRSAIRLTLLDALGREISVLDEGLRDAGVHEATVDGIAGKLSTGMYLYRLKGVDEKTGTTFSASRKLLFMK